MDTLIAEQVAALKQGRWIGPDPLGRAPGEPLWPERHTAADLARVRTNVLDYEFFALYQQAPQQREGALIKAHDMLQIRVEQLPRGLQLVRYWDLAVGESERADWLAGALVGMLARNLYIIHMAHIPAPWSMAKGKIVETMRRDPAAVRQGIEVAGQQGGYFQELRDDPSLRGRIVEAVNPREVGSKRVRAEVWASRIPGRLVHLVVGNGWDVEAFISECVLFPLGAHDDQVDAVSGAAQMLGVEVLATLASEPAPADFGGYGGAEA